MIATSTPVRLVSLAIVALVVLVGARGIAGGIGFNGDILDGDILDQEAGETDISSGKLTRGVVTYVLDGDTVQVTTASGRDVRVRILGISAPEVAHQGEPGECYGRRSTRHLKHLLPAGTHALG